MIRSLQHQLDRVRSMRGVAPGARWPAVKTVVSRRARHIVNRARRRVVTGQVRVVQIALGPRMANHYFWTAHRKDRTWFDVQQRVDFLDRRDPDHTGHFVVESIEHTNDPVTIAGLARHPSGSDVLRRWLDDEAGKLSADLTERLQQNRLLGGAVAGAAKLLLAPDRAESMVDRITDLYQLPDNRLFQVIDSMGWRQPSDSRDTSRSLFADPCRHRLVIAEHLFDTDAIALLLPGATRTTLVAMSDTFGTADFSAYQRWPGVGEITVEHVRSRITRFSREYIELHEATANVAEQVSRQVAATPELIDPDDRRFLAVEVADFLFFQALKIRALDALLTDPDFDHVVLALGEQGLTSEFLRLPAGVGALLDDPRLEIVSTSRSAGIRANFWAAIDEIFEPSPPSLSLNRRVPERLVYRKFDEDAKRLAAAFLPLTRSQRPSVLLGTANNAAYNDSTAGYALELQKGFDVRILHLGRNATDLAHQLLQLAPEAHDIPLDFFAPAPERFLPVAEVVGSRLEHLVPELDQSAASQAAAWVLRHNLQRLTTEVIAPALARMKATRCWFESLSARDELPAAVVLTPNRSPQVSALTNVARRFDVPSIVLEPHAQDANYSRYIKVAGDYYGVMSDYFRIQAAAGLGIDLDRTVTTGSPRQIAPPGYEPEAARRAARRKFEAEHGETFSDDTTYLVFFCQPSDWSHVSKVWRNVLEAAHSNGCRVLLKTHPEESVTRAKGYTDEADRHGLGDLVIPLDCDAAAAIALADIALTAYSAAGIDAALRRTPVICVTDGELSYPVDLPAIIDAPLARSAAELSDLLARFRNHPDELNGRARSLIEREQQFVEGPGPRVRELVADAIARGPAGIRPASEIPASLFLDGPHPEFPV